MAVHFTMPSQVLGSTTHNPFFEPHTNVWAKKNPLYNPKHKSGKTTVGALVARPNIVFARPK
jgi:hypothetical protein